MTSMNITLDIILLLSCGMAIFYCYMLNRRLKALHDLKSGIGEAVVDLAKATKSSQEVSVTIATQTQEAINELNAVLDQVQDYRQEAEDILQNLDGQVHQARTKISKSLKGTETVTEKLTSLNERSRIELKALTQAVEIANKVNALTRDQMLQKVRHQKKEGTLTPFPQNSVRPTPPQDTSIKSNPFHGPQPQQYRRHS
ncbi:MAG: hypothetical protein AAF603_09020 [Pseudomonadota bacterium]